MSGFFKKQPSRPGFQARSVTKTSDIVTVTTPFLEGYTVVQHLGIVCGQAVMATNIAQELTASFLNVKGGRVKDFEAVIRKAREEAKAEMEAEAVALGANAVIMVEFEFNSIGTDAAIRQMFVAYVSGTAVWVEPSRDRQDAGEEASRKTGVSSPALAVSQHEVAKNMAQEKSRETVPVENSVTNDDLGKKNAVQTPPIPGWVGGNTAAGGSPPCPAGQAVERQASKTITP